MYSEDERSFVEIVQEMLEEGFDSKEAVDNLVLLGLDKKDAKKLVDLLGEKAVTNVGSTLTQLVKKKIISLEESKDIEKKRRMKSKKRRTEKQIESIRKQVNKLLKRQAPSQMAVFNERLDDFVAALEEEEISRRELRAFISELQKNLRGREKRAMQRAKEYFNP